MAGVGAYGFWDNFLYAEVTPYVSGRSGAFSFLTAGNPKEVITNGVSPYWRIVLYKNKGSHSFSLGHVGLYDKVYQAGHIVRPTASRSRRRHPVQWNSKPNS